MKSCYPCNKSKDVYKNKIEIIAEIGVNHNGSLKKAKMLIDKAKEAGADYVKFQYFKSKLLSTNYAKKADYQFQQTKDKEIAKFLSIDYWTTIVVYRDNKEVSRSIGQTNKEKIYFQINSI